MSACNAGDRGLIPGLGRSPGAGNGYPSPGEFHGLYSSWGHKESDTIERLHFLSISLSLSVVGTVLGGKDTDKLLPRDQSTKAVLCWVHEIPRC